MKTLFLAAAVALVPLAVHAGEKSRPTPPPFQQARPTTVINQNSNRNDVRQDQTQRQRQHQDQTQRQRMEQTANASAHNRGNHQNVTFRDRLQAPGISGSFSSVAGSPCERAPLGLGVSVVGFGGLFQGPMESDRCWSERQALLLHQMGYTNAAIAVLAGNPVGVAVQNNPVGVRAIRRKN